MIYIVVPQTYGDLAGLGYVAPDEFCQLLTSRKNLVRRDEPGEGLHGLWDTEGGVLYLVETNEFSRIAGRSRLGHA